MTKTLAELNIEKIPSVPQVLLELLTLFHQPEIDFGRITGVIEQDAAICAKILHLARTPIYRPWARVTSVRRLIVMLGSDQVKQIALTSAIHQYFSSLCSDYDDLVTALWVRSLLCGHLAEELAQLTGCAARDEAFTAGLLHRIGQLVLLYNHSDRYLDLLFMETPDSLREPKERDLLGTSYNEVGAILVRDWPLNPIVADAILYQNRSAETLTDASPLVRLLSLAVRLANTVAGGKEDDFAWDDRHFGLTAALLREIAAQARNSTVEAGSRFGIQVENYLGQEKKEPEAKQKSEQRKLAVFIHQAALSGACGEQAMMAPDQEKLLQRIRRELAVAFGFHRMQFLVCVDQGRTLVGAEEEWDDGPFRALSLDLQESASQAAQALREGRIRCTLELSEAREPIAVIDEQMARWLDSEGVLFLPLGLQTRSFGVAAVGISRLGWEKLAPHQELLRLFLQSLSRNLLQSRQALEQQQRQLAEREELNQLEIRKLIHEVNNPLAVITNYLYTLSDQLGEKHPASDDINVIREEIGRIGGILVRLKDVGRRDPGDDGQLELNRVTGDLLRLFQDTLFKEHNIQVQTDLDDSMPTLALSSGAVKQLMINLLKNAGEAMTEGGTVRISTRDRIYKEGKHFVELQISDDGPGLPDQVLGALFEPVTSTKPDHSGLGLVIVKNLVDGLEGEIACASHPKTGTRFQILLPRHPVRESRSSED